MSRTLLTALVLAACTARAHVEKQPKRDRLEIEPARVVLVLDYAVPEGPEARALREQFDRDQSGALEGDEPARVTAYLEAQARAYAQVQVDGRAVALERTRSESALGGGAAARLAVRVTLQAAASPTRSVQLTDRHKDLRITVPVVVVARGVTLAPLPPEPIVFQARPLRIDLQ